MAPLVAIPFEHKLGPIVDNAEVFLVVDVIEFSENSFHAGGGTSLGCHLGVFPFRSVF